VIIEYFNKSLKQIFDDMGIKHERTNVDTPQMNGVAERINRTLLDLVRAMLKNAELPQRFWAETVVTACYIKNRVIHSSINNIPEKIWTGNKPSVKHLKVYDCLVYAHIIKQGRHKLDSRRKECILVGYSNLTKRYRLWDPTKGDIIQTKHVEFIEDVYGYEYIYSKKTFETPFIENNNINDTKDIDEEDTDVVDESNEENKSNANNEIVNVDSQQTTSEKRRGVGRPKKIVRNPWSRAGKPDNIELNLAEIIEPTTYDEAIISPQSKEWEMAINDELESLNERNTWEILNKSEGVKCIGSKWVYKIKTDSTGQVVRYKARVVA